MRPIHADSELLSLLGPAEAGWSEHFGCGRPVTVDSTMDSTDGSSPRSSSSSWAFLSSPYQPGSAAGLLELAAAADGFAAAADGEAHHLWRGSSNHLPLIVSTLRPQRLLQFDPAQRRPRSLLQLPGEDASGDGAPGSSCEQWMSGMEATRGVASPPAAASPAASSSLVLNDLPALEILRVMRPSPAR